MKFSISSILPTLFWFFPLLMCALISLLYACDFINTAFFVSLIRINGILFYGFMGFLLCKVIKKRQFIIALLSSIGLLLVHMTTSSELVEHLIFFFKLILFNLIVLMKVIRQPQSR